ncbi:peptide-methionine (S)-S-oxide reductase MsrA [Candidatus Bipolaricaulota bacterium]|nr:peptide-methionine (S)-S-oxide reductase MsrA [Candidatus Bipolaricaulota bacterium]
MSKHFIYITFTLLLLVLLAGLIGMSALAAEEKSEKSEIPAIDQREYENLKTATFALGCFWGGDARYGAVPGVIRTRVGYAGGAMEDPTYHDLGNHTESIQVDFNPEVVSYEELVDIFWNRHDPYSVSYNTQYANILFYHDDYQKNIAERTNRELNEESNQEVQTQVRPIEKFYPAEPYHQKYRLKQSSPFISVLNDIYPDSEDLRDSTAAARLNGFLAGHGTPDQVEELADKLGLTEDARGKLLNRFGLNGS